MPRIAIVGAGIAGLNAALALQDAGLPCTVYEASERVGGRMHSDTSTWGDGLVSEWCGEFIDGNHSTMHDLVKRFGLETVDLGDTAAGRAPTLMYLRNRFYGAEELARDFEILGPRLRQQVHDVDFPVTYARHTAAAYRLDHMSVHDWIAQYVEAGHDGALGRLLACGCAGYFGLDAREQSSLNLLALFGPRVESRGSTVSRPLQGSSKVVGGSQRLPLAMAGALPDGCIRRGHRLVGLARDHDVLTLRFATADGARVVECDRVILALPFSVLRGVECERARFDPLKRAAIDTLGYGTISKLIMQFDEAYWDSHGPWPREHNGFFITDLDIQTLWDGSIGQRGSHKLLVDYTSGRRGAAFAPRAPYSTTADPSVQSYASECVRQLEHLFPGIAPHYAGTATLSFPTGDPNLLGSYSCWRVAQCTGFAGYEGVAQGPISFAGEHCSVEFQGFMEGAAREGARAAREIVEGQGG